MALCGKSLNIDFSYLHIYTSLPSRIDRELYNIDVYIYITLYIQRLSSEIQAKEVTGYICIKTISLSDRIVGLSK